MTSFVTVRHGTSDLAGVRKLSEFRLWESDGEQSDRIFASFEPNSVSRLESTPPERNIPTGTSLTS